MVGMRFAGFAILLVGVLLLSGCAQQQTQVTPAVPGQGPGQGGHGKHVVDVDESGSTSVNLNVMKQLVYQTPAGTLSDAEKNGILYMREEEKLARDVYKTLYDKWGLQIFANIASSEQTHMEAVKLLIDKYGLEDPAENKGVGEFSNAELQKLYNDLVAEGSKSIEDALKVGAMIEEIDILDLKKHISETDKEDIKLVYENLMKGSRNHLRAFTSTLSKYGVTYEPQYLSREEYTEIVESPMEKGTI